MKSLLARLYLTLCCLVYSVMTLGQEYDDIDMDAGQSRRSSSDYNEMDGMMDYQPIHFGLGDVLMVVMLLVCCYVFGKIWKGCSYLILLLAAAYFYFLR